MEGKEKKGKTTYCFSPARSAGFPPSDASLSSFTESASSFSVTFSVFWFLPDAAETQGTAK